jgi:hypothetical protein
VGSSRSVVEMHLLSNRLQGVSTLVEQAIVLKTVRIVA